MRIDAHQHFWKPERGDYGWLTPNLGVLYRDYLPVDLAGHLRAADIQKTVLVQAAATDAETDFLLSLADETDFIAGVVGWADMEDEGFPQRLERLARHPKFVGIRPMLQDLDDDAFISRPKVLESLKRIADSDVAFDILTFTRHLPHVLKALEATPGLRAVVDHLSKPPIVSGQMQPWADLMAQVADFENVYCKISGMVTEAQSGRWTPEDLAPYVAHVAGCFGPERIMFGSDWPVCLGEATYEEVAALALELVEPFVGTENLELFFGGNAEKFYKLDV